MTSDSYRQRHDVVNITTKQKRPSQSTCAEKRKPSIPNAPPPRLVKALKACAVTAYSNSATKTNSALHVPTTDINGQSRREIEEGQTAMPRGMVSTKTHHQRESSSQADTSDKTTRPETCSRHLQPRALRVGKASVVGKNKREAHGPSTIARTLEGERSVRKLSSGGPRIRKPSSYLPRK
jgi:hypothetical protein